MKFHHNFSKTISRTGVYRTHNNRHHNVRLVMLGMAVLAAATSIAPLFSTDQIASARDYNAKIKALQNQLDDYNNRASELAAQSDTLESKIAELQNQQSQIQAQINLSETKKAQLEQQIADTEAKIKTQAEALSKNLQEQYYSSQTTSLDILMNSNSVSDYVDRQTRQQAMSDQITSLVNDVKKAKAELETQKTDVEAVIKQQNAQKQDLANSQAEQQQLLDQTQGQEARYQELKATTEEKMAQVKAELAAANAAMQNSGGMSSGTLVPGAQGGNGSQCGGGYPTYLCSAPQDSLIDPWGMYSRECVSYAAFRVANTYGYMPYWGGHGMAYQWKGNAESAGYRVTTYPEPGTVAWIGRTSSTPVGHVGFVESVTDSTYIVSEYNSDGRGNYYKKEYPIGSGFTHFLWIGK